MLPTSQLMDLTGQLVALKTCYELTEPEMQKQARLSALPLKSGGK